MDNFRFLFLTLTIASTLSACVQDKPGVEINNAQETISGVINLPHRDNWECPEELYDCEREHLRFDVNSYFDVLDQLEIEDGYILDYVYRSIATGGEPIIYAVEGNELPFATHAEYCTDILGFEWWEGCEPLDFQDDYLKHIIITDTPEGYFQFVILASIGDVFYLAWHADYDRIDIISTEDEALMTFTELASRRERDRKVDTFWGWGMKQSLKRIDYTPSVELTADVAIVRIIKYSEWEGFVEIVAEISRDFPHEIISWEETVLIEYIVGLIL
jgi:hypothetical protein